MLEIIYKFLFFLSKKGKKNTFLFNTFRKVAKLLINIIYPAYFKVFEKKEVGIDIGSNQDVIVTLTSFPGRIKYIWICIETLLRQDTKPNKIILWLAESQFNGLDDLPPELLKLQKRGLTIRFCEDLRSHKKYYYTMKEFPNSNIVIVDDDMFYPKDLITKLLETSIKYPGTICCTRGHHIQNKDDIILPYSKWLGKSGDDSPSYELCPTGCGGVLYPPNSLNEKVFEKDDIKKLCINADDLWLKIMSLLNNTKAVKTDPDMIGFIDIMQTQKVKLTKSNVGENMNDIQLENILRKYKINTREYFRS
ncbi:glycosyltransferase [Metabacillus indicus]|uniref:glycosyltransferase n=1 Tax=Metabacillus indicus TaxID=246786 RepID=UPI003CF24C85